MENLKEILKEVGVEDGKIQIYAIKYIPENLIIYIGQTNRTLKERLVEHYKSGVEELKQAFRFHGEENFSIETMNIVAESEADVYEAYKIIAHRTFAPWGFNSTFPVKLKESPVKLPESYRLYAAANRPLIKGQTLHMVTTGVKMMKDKISEN